MLLEQGQISIRNAEEKDALKCLFGGMMAVSWNMQVFLMDCIPH